MKEQPRLNRMIANIFVLLFCSTSSAQVRTIYEPLYAKVTVDRPVTITAKDNTQYILKEARIDGINIPRAQEMGFSWKERRAMLAFALSNACHQSRQVLEARQEACSWIFIPLSSIESLIVTNLDESMEVTVTPRTSGLTIPPLALDYSMCRYIFKGEEDMGDFGQAKYEQMMAMNSPIKSITFPQLAETPLAAQNSLTVTVTEVCGKKHFLSDIRLPANTFTFWRRNSKLKLPPDKVQNIEVIRPVNPGSEYDGFVCSVTLKTGARKELIWKEINKGLAGKSAGGWYELIPVKAIKTVEFTN